MPLTTDEKLLNLSRDVVEAFDKADGGVHPGFRPAHAKGILLTGTFTPSKEATSLTRAPHIQRASTPVTVRLSDFAGIPTVADNDQQNASPRGCAIRFHLDEHVHTDIVAHSVDTFPSRTARRVPGLPQRAHRHRPRRPAPQRHRAIPRHPSRSSELRPDAQAHPDELRQRIVLRRLRLQIHQRRRRQPIRPLSHPPRRRQRISRRRRAAAASPRTSSSTNSKTRIAKGPVKFRIVVQLAKEGDTTDDATVRWPEDRPQLTFGEITLTAIAPDNAAEQQHSSSTPSPESTASKPPPTRSSSRAPTSTSSPENDAEPPDSSEDFQEEGSGGRMAT